MKILGHIHTLNDEEVIDRSLQAMLDQTYPLEEILIVDNGSTDGTLRRSFPVQVTVFRHPENRGTSGAVAKGLQYGLTKQYDWVWLFDADSAPRSDALEKLLELYHGFSPDLQEQTWLVASLPMECSMQRPWHGATFTPRGPKPVEVDAAKLYYECHVTIWTGSLFKLAAVQKVGLPAVDYVNDGGEGEYAYRGMRAGYRSFIHQRSLIDHNIGAADPKVLCRHLGPFSVRLVESPPMRYYYVFRNTVYFWLYEYHEGNILHVLRAASRWPKQLVKLVLLSRWSELWACLRGLRDGLCKNMHHRY